MLDVFGGFSSLITDDDNEEEDELQVQEYLPNVYKLADRGIIIDSVKSCVASVPSRESFLLGIKLPCQFPDDSHHQVHSLHICVFIINKHHLRLSPYSFVRYFPSFCSSVG